MKNRSKTSPLKKILQVLKYDKIFKDYHIQKNFID